MEFHVPPVLILGIGNILLRDEGVGVRVVEAMRDTPLPPDAELADGGTSGANLVDLVADRRKVIVIDALDAEAEPGSVFRLHAEDLMPRRGESISLHELGLLDTLAMASRLGCAPREVVVFGIQPKEINPGLSLSSEVQAALPKAIGAVLDELRGNLDHPTSVVERVGSPGYV
jgi:hydrogenase maturation protease